MIQQLYIQLLELLRRNYNNKVKTDVELTKICKSIFGKKYIGTFAYNQFSTKNGYSIINTDDSNGHGIHWIAIYKKGKNIYIYDSFGRKTKNVLNNFHQKWNKKYKLIDSKNDAEQSDYQEDCGIRCISWLLCVDKINITEALKI